jgi:hypothetical protein
MLFILFSCSILADAKAIKNQNYEYYHKQVIEAEKLIADEKYSDALFIYENIFSTYDFVFLRDYQVATQLALQLNEEKKAKDYLKKGIESGWKMKSIKKNKYLSKLFTDPTWKSIRTEYNSLKNNYEARLNQKIRKKVKRMFSKDQWKAVGALFTFSAKRQDSYAERKFAPHSEKQIEQVIKIVNENGYPGERLIGNNFWMATILSHHNSISKEYTRKDTLYPFLKPKLLTAIRNGQMSPWEFAIIDDWYRAVKFSRQEIGYGYLNSPSQAELLQVNELRQIIGLRTIEIRNRLLDIEKLTGMNFYLPGNPWVEGKIIIKE